MGNPLILWYNLSDNKNHTKHLQAGVPEDALNSYLTMVKNSVPSEPIVQIDDSRLKYAIFKAAKSLRVKVAFNHYRISTGIANTLRHAQTDVRDWHKPRRRSA